MKILRLRLKNIRSLRGEWDIRFDAPPLSDTGLFAITGPNGAGKSSILDAITLGLYGETVRIRNPEGDITSWIEDESYAEVTFRIGEDVYRSRWWARKGAQGIIGPEMSLSSFNGTEKTLEDRIIPVRSRLGELSGLDFKRFCRSVLLPQGEFGAFLNALESERADILEKIIGAEVAQELAQEFESRRSAAQERLAQLKELAANYPPVDRERLGNLEKDREALRDDLEETIRRIRELQEQKERLEALKHHQEELQEAERMLAEAEIQDARAREEWERLEKILVARPLADSLLHSKAMEEEREALRTRLEALQREVAAERARLHEAQERLVKAQESLESERQRLAQRSRDLEDVLERDREIDRQTQRLHDCLAQRAQWERTRQDLYTRREQLKARLEEAAADAKALQDHVSKAAADAPSEQDLEILQNRLERLTQLRRQEDALEDQLTHARQILEKVAAELDHVLSGEQRLQAQVGQAVLKKEALIQDLKKVFGEHTPSSFKESLNERRRNLTAYKKLLPISKRYHAQGFRSDIDRERDQVLERRRGLQAALEEALEEFTKFQSDVVWRDSFQRLSSERDRLQEGRPCPLCGSLSHPFVAQGLPDLSQLYAHIDTLEQRIASLKSELSHLDRKASELERQAAAAQEIRREWDDVCRRAGLSLEILEPQSLVERIRLLKESIRHDRSALRWSRFKQWRLRWTEAVLRRRLEKSSKEEQKRHLLEDQLHDQQKTLSDLEAKLRRLREEDQTVTGDVESFLRAYGEKAPEKGAESRLLQRLRMRRETYRRALVEQQGVADRIRSLEAQRESIEADVLHAEKEVEKSDVEAQAIQSHVEALKAERESLYPGIDPAAELRAMEDTVAQLSRQTEELSQEIQSLIHSLEARDKEMLDLASELEPKDHLCETLRKDLAAQCEAMGVDSLETAYQVIPALEEEPKVRQRVGDARQALEDARSRVLSAQRALAALGEILSSDAPEDLAARIAELEKRRETLEDNLGEVERRLDDIRRSVQEHLDLLRAVEDQERQCTELAAEEKTFRDAEGPEVLEKRRRLMLQRLIDQANTHLELLSGRYRLRSSADNGFGLVVEDLMQQRNRRPLRTLSGGETFVVSLSMALGLSELAAHHRKIESLFIDEGFGSLDDDMLYRVMTALRRLEANGKTVGIISHVKRLADEIPTQIRVERGPGGDSRIIVVP